MALVSTPCFIMALRSLLIWRAGPRAISGLLLSLLASLVHMESSDSKPSRAPAAEVGARVEGVFEDFLSDDMRLVWEIGVEHWDSPG